MNASTCDTCGEPLNPVAALIGTTCGDCTREKHQEATHDH